MATWTQSNPVSIGDATKKQHYDKVFDNSLALMSSMLVQHVTPSGGAYGGQHAIMRQNTEQQTGLPGEATRYEGNIVCFEGVAQVPDYNAPGADYTIALIDDSIDWRDRKVSGQLFAGMCATLALAQKFIPGGAKHAQAWFCSIADSIAGFTEPDDNGIMADVDVEAAAHRVFTAYTGAGIADSSFPFTFSGAPAGFCIPLGYLISGGSEAGAWIYVSTDGGKLKLATYNSGEVGLNNYAFFVLGEIRAHGDEQHI